MTHYKYGLPLGLELIKLLEALVLEEYIAD